MLKLKILICMFVVVLLLFDQDNCLHAQVRRNFRKLEPIGKRGFARKPFVKVTIYFFRFKLTRNFDLCVFVSFYLHIYWSIFNTRLKFL